jgi:pSer/pThr/pTyr-binding forkhead associated (FHA) protein
MVENPVVKMGRGHESEIKIPDISVSRCHALIHYRDGEFYVEDNNSKFGTLIKAQEGITLREPKEEVTVQIGRTVLICTVGENAWLKSLKPPQVATPPILN